jgi:predicted NUDIX family NTP pyrophosphohydrolase
MKASAGILIYRVENGVLEVLLIHPGGPFWQKKEDGAWSIPKGEVAEKEDALDAACREFKEETGFDCGGPFLKLTPVKQSSRKTIHTWAAEGNYDPAALQSNAFSIEWPPRSGQIQYFPEADRAEWFTIPEARKKILKGQLPLLNELEKILTS